MLGLIKKWMRNKALKKRLSAFKRNKQFCNIETTKTVGILYAYEGRHSNSLINNLAQLFSTHGIATAALGYHNDKTLPSEYAPRSSNLIFCSTGLEWSGVPVCDEVEKFIAKDFDIFIDLSRKEDFIFKYIGSLSKAKFKIGGLNYVDNPFDFVFLENSHDDEKFVDQIFQFLLVVKA